MTHAAWALAVIVTTYAGQYIGEPLFCDSGQGLIYDPAATEPWLAFDFRLYLSGDVHCGDLIHLTFPDGTTITARALDAGFLADYYIADYPDLPIVDLPAHLAPFAGLSSPAYLVNVSALQRELERRQIPQ